MSRLVRACCVQQPIFRAHTVEKCDEIPLHVEIRGTIHEVCYQIEKSLSHLGMQNQSQNGKDRGFYKLEVFKTLHKCSESTKLIEV